MPNISPGLHNEIAQLEQHLETKKAELKQQQESGTIGEMPHDKEILRETLHEKFIPAPQQTTQQDDDQDDVAQDQQPTPQTDTQSGMTPEIHNAVQQLVDTAFTKSITEAANQAQKTNNPALIDAFHDALVDQLYDDLVERGKLKKL
ncbi:MAG: hypothetical protein ABH833_00070 [Parcubacteria group bacterium]